MKHTDIISKFKELFQKEPLIVRSPGRINLIGEHTDYNMGFVLPAAIDKEIVFAISNNGTKQCNVYAYNLSEQCSFYTNKLKSDKTEWLNYIQGVVSEMQNSKFIIQGFDCVFGGDIPQGAGLSSSAAIECALAYALNELNQLRIEKLDLVKLAQKAENNFVGVKCGIMDQFASVFGKKDHVIQLDCRSLEYHYFNINLDGYSIVLADTQVKHKLASSEYNIRRKECETGVKILQKHNHNIQSLRDVTPDFLEKYNNELEPVIYNRCKYVVEENNRLVEGCKDLNDNRLFDFGQKMFATHDGLSNLYQVSCSELDLLVDIAKKSEGVVGARMMGGGFGGCTINIIKDSLVDDFIEKTTRDFNEKIGSIPLFYKVKITDGTGIL
ncbi:MAG: galactokinase [Bacteroidales bacterium]|nr:galactokinase [Bacteroidales bacterium]